MAASSYPLSTPAIRLYSALFRLVLTLGVPILLSGRRKKKWRARQRLRLPTRRTETKGHDIVWLHAASLGEVKVLLDFMEVLSDKHPEDRYVLTAVTETGVNKILTSVDERVCGAGYFPFDTISSMEQLLDRFAVQRVWLMETELWPSLLWVCKQRRIPVGIVNARMEEKSFRSYRRFRSILVPLLEHVGPVLAQDETYAGRFVAAGVKSENIIVTGNLKSRVIVKRPSREQWLQLRKRMRIANDDVVITAGCIRAGEAGDIRKAIDSQEPGAENWKWIIVPRHQRDVAEILGVLGGVALHLTELDAHEDWRVCVVEKYGVMEDMYRIADAAVVGGTFIDIGGHNMWEPAQFGIPVLWGPYSYKQRESCDRLVEAGVGFEAHSGEELAQQLVRVLRTESKKFIVSVVGFMESIKHDMNELEHVLP